MTARSELAPGGRLRAAINCGNPVLARRGGDGAVAGVTVDLASAFARALGVALDLIPYDGAGAVVSDANADRWDVAFLAIDPKRGETLGYTRPYVNIEGVFAVRSDAPFKAPGDLDRAGVTIGVGEGAAYDLHLSRAFSNAAFRRYRTSAAVLPAILADGLDAGAGVRQPIEAFARATPGLRVIAEPFMTIAQAVAVPRAKAGAEAAPVWLQGELDRLAREGFIRAALKRAGQDEGLAAE